MARALLLGHVLQIDGDYARIRFGVTFHHCKLNAAFDPEHIKVGDLVELYIDHCAVQIDRRHYPR